MSIDEARRAIADDNAGFEKWVLAAGVIASADASSLEDLVRCLRRRGLPSEIAATALYVRTGRPRTGDSIQCLVLDEKDWSAYVQNR